MLDLDTHVSHDHGHATPTVSITTARALERLSDAGLPRLARDLLRAQHAGRITSAEAHARAHRILNAHARAITALNELHDALKDAQANLPP